MSRDRALGAMAPRAAGFHPHRQRPDRVRLDAGLPGLCLLAVERVAPTKEAPMNRSGMFRSNKALLILVACICFAIAVLTTAGILSIGNKIDWTNLGLFFGFLSFIF
jgi:hypothetical protein